MIKIMEMEKKLKEYTPAPSQAEVGSIVEKAKNDAKKRATKEVYSLCYSCIDLTTLAETDNEKSVKEFTRKTKEMNLHYPRVDNVASICVFPVFVETVGLELGSSDIKITSVAGGFPASQTFLEVKLLEIAMAIENGADEIDIVINVGDVLAGESDRVFHELKTIREEINGDVVLKVIIESGALKTPEQIKKASLLSMLSGADFVKTSTGKIAVAATPEATVVICQAIKEFHEKTGKRVGFKAAGGVRTPEDAALYYTIVENILGKEWLNPTLFRIGASSAANNLLSAIEGKEVKYY